MHNMAFPITCIITVVSQISAHGHLNTTHNFDSAHMNVYPGYKSFVWKLLLLYLEFGTWALTQDTTLYNSRDHFVVA